MPMTAATGKAFKINDCCENRNHNFVGIKPAIACGGTDAENPRLGKYPKISGSQAPQMANSRTIMRNNLKRIVVCMLNDRRQEMEGREKEKREHAGMTNH